MRSSTKKTGRSFFSQLANFAPSSKGVYLHSYKRRKFAPLRVKGPLVLVQAPRVQKKLLKPNPTRVFLLRIFSDLDIEAKHCFQLQHTRGVQCHFVLTKNKTEEAPLDLTFTFQTRGNSGTAGRGRRVRFAGERAHQCRPVARAYAVGPWGPAGPASLGGTPPLPGGATLPPGKPSSLTRTPRQLHAASSELFVFPPMALLTGSLGSVTRK